MVRLKCQCCGFVAEFESGEKAFKAGWDAPPYFMQHVCCPICPAACVVLGKGHKIAHALWQREGRPKDFSIDKCASDDIIGEPKKIAQVEREMDLIEKVLK